MSSWDIVVIGAGPAGLTAGMYAARRNLTATILEAKSPGGQMAASTLIENYPGFPDGIDGQTLSDRMREQTLKHGVKVEAETAVSIRRDGEGFSVLCTSGRQYPAKAVIIASGAAVRKLGIKNEETFSGKGISYCTSCDGPLFKGKAVAVVGGGSSAVSAALYLEKVARKVYLIHRRDELRAEEALVKKLGESTITPLWSTVVDSVAGTDRLEKITTKDTKTNELRELAVDGLFIEIGAVSSTEMVRELGVKTDEHGHVYADQKQETNVPGIYAAGDVTGRLAQITVAVGDATVAAIRAYEYIRKREKSKKA